MALNLYVSGAARTQKEAADAAGVSSATVSNARRSPAGRAFEENFDTQVAERSMSLSAVIARLSAKALDVMEEQILNGSTEEVQFKAAKDILDRNPETSKMQKVQLESFTLGNKDAKEIARALTEGMALRSYDAEVAEGDFVRVQEVSEQPSLMGEV